MNEASSMDLVNVVATWVGLFTGIAGIVLSLIAMWFTFKVNDRADKVNDQTIQSLQKIESVVQRLSEDTTGLIKAGWDKMLGGVGTVKESASEATDLKALRAGIVQELKTELLAVLQPGSRPEQMAEQMREVVERIGPTLERPSSSGAGRPSRVIQTLSRRLQKSSPVAVELARALAKVHRHLTREQYVRLRANPETREAIDDLRRKSLLVPLAGVEGGKESLVYWFPPGLSRYLSSAVLLHAEVPDASRTIQRALRDVGYVEIDG